MAETTTPPARLRFILTPLGSAGDVHPFLWLAEHLVRAGHEVHAIVQAPFAEAAARAGLSVTTTSSEEEARAVLADPDLWHPHRAFDALARRMPGWAAECIAALDQVGATRPDTVILSGPINFGSRIFGEARGVPVLTVQLSPAVFMSLDAPPVPAPGWDWFPGLPKLFVRGLYRFVRWNVDRQLARPLNTIRDKMGLREPVRGLIPDYWNSPDGVVCLFPDWFGAPAADWPIPRLLLRFPLHDGTCSADDPSRARLEEFLAAGDAPIVFTPGSANIQAARFFKVALDVCERLGRRGLFLTRHAPQVPTPLPTGVLHVEWLPLGEVLPRCAALVHHGGIGTLAQGLAAGVPQFTTILAHDQAENTRRLRTLGVGNGLVASKWNGTSGSAGIGALLASTRVREACDRVRRAMTAQMTGDAAAGALEAMAREALGRRGTAVRRGLS